MTTLQPRIHFSDEGGGRPLYAAAITAVLGLLVAMIGILPAQAVAGGNVVICHATNDNNGPYQQNPPDDGSKVVQGHASHTGPVWNATLKAAHIQWGDIIPPFDYTDNGVPKHFDGLNWDVYGQETYYNSCVATLPDLQMTKTGSADSTVGATGAWYLSVSNIGNGTTRDDLTVTDTMPTGVTPTAASGTGWSCTIAGATVTCTTSSTLAPSSSANPITIDVTWASQGTKVNTATVSPDAYETATANNSDDDTVVVGPAVVLRPDVAVDKNGPATAVQGSTANSYTIDVSNAATATAGTGAFTMTDTLPTGETATATSFGSTGTAWTGCSIAVGGGSVSCTHPGLAIGAAAAQVTVTVTVDASVAVNTVLTDTAAVATLTNESVTSNNSDSVDTTVTAAPVAPDLVQLKTGTTSAYVGDSGSYSLSVRNDGGATTAALTVTDTLPAGVSLNGAPTGTNWTCTTQAAAPQVSCTQDAGSTGLAAGATSSVITVPVTFGADAVGTATDSASVGTVAGEKDTTDNTKTFDTTVAPRPSGTVTKTNDGNGDEAFHVDETAPTVSHDVMFKLHITNTSPYTVDVSDARDFVGNDEQGVGVECLPALRLAAGESGDCYFTAPAYSPADGVTKSNVATVKLTRVTEQAPALRRITAAAVALPPSTTIRSNVSTVVTHVPVVVTPRVPVQDLSIVKTGPTVAKPGDSVSYTLTVTNLGDATSGFTVTDKLPTGLTATSIGGLGFLCDLATVSCNYPGTLAAGGTAVATVVATVNSTFTGNSLVNTGVVSPTDATPGNNSSSYTLPIAQPGPGEDLALSKTGPGSAAPGDELVWDLKVTNVKGTPATNFVVTDTLPAGLSYSGAGGTGFTCTNAGQVITCAYTGTLPVGAAATIVVRALLAADYQPTTVVNAAIVDPATPDTDATDNQATATTQVVKPIIGGGGGGGQISPSPSPSPSPTAAPAAGGDSGPGALPFTGSYTDRLLQGGVLLLLAGLILALVARRRSAHQH